MSKRPQRIAFIGARGLGNYGGFETFVSEITPRLHQRGFEVYCASRRPPKGALPEEYKGVRISYFPLRFPRSSKLGRLFEILYDWYFALRFSFVDRVDVAYCLGIAPGLISPLARLSGAKLIINIDGVEWKRAKFSLAERSYIKMSYMAAYLGSNRVLLDNEKLAGHVPDWVLPKSVVIPYGVSPRQPGGWDTEVMRRAGRPDLAQIRPHNYWLVVARLEPENSIHQIVEAHKRSKTGAPLLVVGDFSADSYRRKVESIMAVSGDERIILAGSIYDRELLDMLRANCLGYIHGHTVGGTNPSLLEAMACGNLILAHGNEFNREVARDGALYFSDAESLRSLLDDAGTLAGSRRIGEIARARSAEAYSWDAVVEAYAALFSEL